MSDEFRVRIRPLKLILGSKSYGIAVSSPKIFVLKIANGKLFVCDEYRDLDSFFLKKLMVKQNPTKNEFHIRTDGLALLLTNNEAHIIDDINDRISEALDKSGSVKSQPINRPLTKAVQPRFASPSQRSTLDLQPKTSGVVSREKVGVAKPDSRIQSPPRLPERKVYTQSPLKSPFKERRVNPSEDYSSVRGANLEDTVFPNISTQASNVVNLKTYGRKRTISAVSSFEKGMGLMEMEKAHHSQKQENSDAYDIFSDNMVDSNNDYATSFATADDYQSLELLSTQSTSTPVKSVTKNIVPKPMMFSHYQQYEPKAASATSTAAIFASPMATSVKSKLNPIHEATSIPVYKQSRMRYDSPTSSTQTTMRNLSNLENSLVRTPEDVSLHKRSSIFGAPSVLSTYGSRPFTSASGILVNPTNNFFLDRPAPMASVPMLFEGKYEGGIRNLGNTCYMSAVLQALSSVRGLCSNMHNPLWSSIYSRLTTPPAVAIESKGSDDAEGGTFQSPTLPTSDISSVKPPYISSDKSIFCHLSNMLRLLETKRNISINPVDLQDMEVSENTNRKMGSLLKIERKISVDPMKFRACIISQQDKYADFSQQDAQEFLTDLMNELEEDMWRAVRTFWMYLKVTAYLTNKQKELQMISMATPSPASILAVPKTIANEVMIVDDDADLHDHHHSGSHHVVSDTSTSSEQNLPSIDPEVEQAFIREVDQHERQIKSLLPSMLFFESTMQSMMTCVDCGYHHEPRFEAYRDFSLDILPADDGENSRNSQELPPREIHLYELTKRYLQPESRELRCPHCESGRKVRMYKQLTTIAPVMVFHLKRFQYDRNIQQFRKIDSSVKFPSRLSLRSAGMVDDNTLWSKLDAKVQMLQAEAFKRIFDGKDSALSLQSVEQRLESALHLAADLREGKVSKGIKAFARQDDSEYQLTAVVRHYGISIGGGHYICDVRNHKAAQENNNARWLRYNDATVTAISEDAVMNEMETPYLLFYQKISK